MHPGEMLREDVLPALDKPKTEIARMLGISRQTLYDILAPAMALRLGTPWQWPRSVDQPATCLRSRRRRARACR
jgi:hypothetical protein